MINEGGIAQLVERLLCKQDVSGSNPLTSTNSSQVFKSSTVRTTASRIQLLDLKKVQKANLENCIKSRSRKLTKATSKVATKVYRRSSQKPN